ncbi:MAG TPA: 2-succinyl-6-hydroxy-2,4-cyclohexadiene-1-carboxylate synthase [Ktedonobacteraceae bacterium]|nr:2-succinyl-6-hydroxy-2,4-cyclohexadiene-1-carboxylate synthase [Ktedonobacteraceae bacterium]
MEKQRIEVNGVQIGVLLGSESQGCQQTLVLLHGFTGSAEGWRDLFPLLERPGRRLIALDMLGHGHSDAPEDPRRYSIEHCQADILAVLEALGIRPGEAIMLGYSMGGRIALYTAFSGFFRALILESASPGLADPTEREQRRLNDEALAELIENEGIETFIDFWEKLPLFASQRSLSPEARAALRAQRLTNRASGLANSLRGVGTGVQPALQERLPALDLPALLLAGELDDKFRQIARQMAERIPQAHLQIVPGAGHAIHLEQPALFAEQVNTFCCELS